MISFETTLTLISCFSQPIFSSFVTCEGANHTKIFQLQILRKFTLTDLKLDVI